MPPLLPLMPGPGGAEVFFHLGQPFSHRTATSNQEIALSHAHTVCVRGKPANLVAAPANTNFVAARIRAGAVPALTGAPTDALTDRFVPADAIWGAACLELLEQLVLAPSIAERVSLLDAFFLARFRSHKNDRDIGQTIQLLQTGQHRIADLAKSAGLGPRQFEIRFQAATGSSPVRFRRLARLRRSIRALLLSPSHCSLTSLIDPGYSDQAQQTREFRELTGFSPKELRRASIDHAHFYNSPWPAHVKINAPLTSFKVKSDEQTERRA